MIEYELITLFKNKFEKKIQISKTKDKLDHYIKTKSDKNTKMSMCLEVFKYYGSKEVYPVSKNSYLHIYNSFFLTGNFLVFNHEIKSSKIVEDDNKSTMDVIKNRYIGGFFGNFLSNSKRSVVLALKNNKTFIFNFKDLASCESLNDRFLTIIETNQKESDNKIFSNLEEKLEEIQNLLTKGILSQEEYEVK